MQRTVKGTKISFVEATENGFEIKSVAIPEADEKKAVKKLTKAIGTKTIVKTEPYEQTYYLDDEIFFKYATTEKGE